MPRMAALRRGWTKAVQGRFNANPGARPCAISVSI